MNTMNMYLNSSSSLASDAFMHATRLVAGFVPAKHTSSRAGAIAKLRAMAERIRPTDPRFASDLLAAADRGEYIDSTSR